MKYYSLKSEISPLVVGVPKGERQIDKMIDSYNLNAPNSVRHIKDTSLILDFEPNLHAQILKEKANATDMISSMRINSIVAKIFSDRFIQFLKQFNIPEFKIYHAPIVKFVKGREEWYNSYFMFMLVETANTHINFEKSDFVFKPIVYDPKLEWVATNIDDYKDLQKKLIPKPFIKGTTRLYGKKIVLKKHMNFDIIRLQLLGGYFVSENLKEAIEKEGFTGMYFEEAPNIVKDK